MFEVPVKIVPFYDGAKQAIDVVGLSQLMKGAVADLLAEEAEFPGIGEIELFQAPHIRIDETIEYPLAAGHDLIFPDRLGIFCINNAKLGQEEMFILYFIGIV